MSKSTKIFAAVSGVIILFLFFVVLAFISTRPPASVSAAAQPIQPTSEQKKRAQACGKLLGAVKGSIWTSMRQDGNGVMVVVAPGFTVLDYDARARFTATTACYYDDAVTTIIFLDPYTHQGIGHWYKGTELTFDR